MLIPCFSWHSERSQVANIAAWEYRKRGDSKGLAGVHENVGIPGPSGMIDRSKLDTSDALESYFEVTT